MAESEEDKVLDEKDPELDGEEEEKDEDVVIEKVDDKPPVRRSSTFFAQQRIIAKQKKQLDAKDKEEDEEMLTPAAQALIRKELSPFVETLKSQSDELELREYLVEHPEHKKFEKQARQRIEAWPNVPVSDIFKTLTFGKPNSEADIKKKEAEKKAKEGSLGGSTLRSDDTSNIPITPKEMQDAYERVKRGETIKLG